MDKLSERDLNKIHKLKQEEQRQELEKVKQRRLEREREREERSQLMELEDRKRENDKFASWQKDEDKFHLQQARLRSQIRISDGRCGHLKRLVFMYAIFFFTYLFLNSVIEVKFNFELLNPKSERRKFFILEQVSVISIKILYQKLGIQYYK